MFCPLLEVLVYFCPDFTMAHSSRFIILLYDLWPHDSCCKLWTLIWQLCPCQITSVHFSRFAVGLPNAAAPALVAAAVFVPNSSVLGLGGAGRTLEQDSWRGAWCPSPVSVWEAFDNALNNMLWILDSPEEAGQLDSMILVGALQLK